MSQIFYLAFSSCSRSAGEQLCFILVKAARRWAWALPPLWVSLVCCALLIFSIKCQLSFPSVCVKENLLSSIPRSQTSLYCAWSALKWCSRCKTQLFLGRCWWCWMSVWLVHNFWWVFCQDAHHGLHFHGFFFYSLKKVRHNTSDEWCLWFEVGIWHELDNRSLKP